MPSSTQIIPKYSFPHVETYINDNSTYYETPSSDSASNRFLCVFSSPKGVDGTMTTVDGGLSDFLEKFGMGSFANYGQPLLNAYALASSGNAVLQCMRVVPSDATYANLGIFANYTLNETDTTVDIPTTDTYTSFETLPSEYKTTVILDDEALKTVATEKGYVSVAISTEDSEYTVSIVKTEGTEAEVTTYQSITEVPSEYTKVVLKGEDELKTLASEKSTREKIIKSITITETSSGSGVYLVTTIIEATKSTGLDINYSVEALPEVTGSSKSATFEESLSKYLDVDEDSKSGQVLLFALKCKGRGKYGNNYSLSVTNDTYSNKTNDYQNYIFKIYDSEDIDNPEAFTGSIYTEAMYNDESIYIQDVINDVDSGSSNIEFYVNSDAVELLYNLYASQFSGVGTDVCPVTIETFDPLLGINRVKGKGALTLFNLDTTSTNVRNFNSTAGVDMTLQGGDDGKFVSGDYTTKGSLEKAYYDAFNGTTDPTIASKTKFPVSIILDANYSTAVKNVIGQLVTKRTDCVGIFDCGTSLKTKGEEIEWIELNIPDLSLTNAAADLRCKTIMNLYGKVKCPYSKKVVTVTYTYFLANSLPGHFTNYGGKHVPFAGSNYGVLSGFIKGSVTPIYDEDVDADLMEELCDARINFARLLPDGSACIATQTTRQNILSDLSELNAVLIVLDVKRDAENLVSTYDYLFNDPEVIVRFNNDIKDVLAAYQGTMVTNITGSFSQSSWEEQRNILHLYITIENKGLVKTVITEIDIN